MSKEFEALKCLEKIKNSFGCDMAYYNLNLEYETVEKALIKAQKQEKVLKLILKKQVDIDEIKILLSNLKHCDDIERCKRYNASRKVGYKLKQEEFDIIKKYLDYVKIWYPKKVKGK